VGDVAVEEVVGSLDDDHVRRLSKWCRCELIRIAELIMSADDHRRRAARGGEGGVHGEWWGDQYQSFWLEQGLGCECDECAK
jgi:hypothetical protein